MTTKSQYTQSHTPAILDCHARRRIADSAKYLEPHLSSSQKLLDVGCGPGSITLDFASRVKEVVGIDQAEKAVEAARKAKEGQGVENVEFRVGDVMELEFGDASFDVTHAHQVILYLPAPRSSALKEMRRVTKPGGLVAVCDGDLSTFIVYPTSPTIDASIRLFDRVCRHNGGEPDSARRLLSYALEAGWKREEITTSASTWCYSKPEEVASWSVTWVDMFGQSAVAQKAEREGFASREELDAMAEAWAEWREHDDAWFAMLNGEILCRV